jgi:hypothetical protein
MSLYPCSACGERTSVGVSLCQATWAWWRADNQRVAYRQRLCVACFAMTIAPLEVASREQTMTCPACGIDTSEDMDPVYCTAYVPSLGRVRLELPCCAPCAAELRLRAQKGAQKLEDRVDGFVGRGPRTEAPSPWEELGIEPR